MLANSDYSNEENATMFKEVLDSLVDIHKVNLGVGAVAEAESSISVSESHETYSKQPKDNNPPEDG